MGIENYNFNKTTSDPQWLMIDLWPDTTGLPFIVFVVNSKSVDDDLGPRLRVAKHNGCIVDTSNHLRPLFFDENKVEDLTGTFPPDKILPVQKFINEHLTTLLAFWEGKLNGAQLKYAIKTE
jgi:hypothetical protein